jgi:1-acyl-sn-glycerol-3-phosphate acyltransferase
MVYRFLYYFANLIIRLYYRKFYVNRLDQIPKDKPLLIVSNHPNGFLEPIVMACLFPIDLHFLVRGDLFENKALRWLLVSTNQVPIYRFKDGIAALRNNQKTIEKTIEVLKQNKAVIIFAEGSTDATWHVRELKKGMARMAFQCLDGSPDLDLHILPIGVTFQELDKPGTDVILNAGKAFSVRQFYSKNVREAKEKMDQLTDFTRQEIQKLTIHLNIPDGEPHLKALWKNYIHTSSSSFLPRVKEDHTLYENLKKEEALLNEGKQSKVNVLPYKSYIHLLLWPFAIVGFVAWMIPVSLGFYISNKYVKQIEFISSVRAASSGFLVLIYSIIAIAIGFIKAGMLYTIVAYFILFICGIVTVYVWERHKLMKIS